MEAEFIKQTIIMSLENDIRIDLNNYTHHLKDFETQLTDIRKFKAPVTSAQATSISKLHIAVKHLEKEKDQFAKELVWALNKINEQKPVLIEKLEREKDKENVYNEKLNKIDDAFKTKQSKTIGEINVYDDKLKTAKKLSEEYTSKNISYIISRVSKKHSLDKQLKNLSEEKDLLSTQFKELAQMFQALLDKLENQWNDFVNGKTTEKLKISSALLNFKELTRRNSDKLINEIRTEQKKEIENVRKNYENKKQDRNDLIQKKEGTKHKRFFEKEIEETKALILELQKGYLKLNSDLDNNKREIETFEKQWGFDEKDLQKTFERDKEKLRRLMKQL